MLKKILILSFLSFSFSFAAEKQYSDEFNARLSNVIMDTLKDFYARQSSFKDEMELLKVQVKASGIDPQVAMPIMEEMRLSQEALKFLVYAVVNEKTKDEILSVIMQMKEGGI